MNQKPSGAKLLLHSKCDRKILLPARPAGVDIEVCGSRIVFTKHLGSFSYIISRFGSLAPLD
jgi:hypothetical protein